MENETENSKCASKAEGGGLAAHSYDSLPCSYKDF